MSDTVAKEAENHGAADKEAAGKQAVDKDESLKDDSGPGLIRVRNRALILTAAEEVFATQGYRGATTAARLA